MSVSPATLAYTDRFKLRSAVYLLPRRAGKVLLALRQNTGFGDGMYGVIGGHLDGNEPARLALVREAEEEAGIVISPNAFRPCLAMHRAPQKPYDEVIDFFFDLLDWSGEPINAEPHKCAGFLWAAPSDLPTNTIPYIAHAIQAIEYGEHYTEFGWD